MGRSAVGERWGGLERGEGSGLPRAGTVGGHHSPLGLGLGEGVWVHLVWERGRRKWSVASERVTGGVWEWRTRLRWSGTINSGTEGNRGEGRGGLSIWRKSRSQLTSLGRCPGLWSGHSTLGDFTLQRAFLWNGKTPAHGSKVTTTSRTIRSSCDTMLFIFHRTAHEKQSALYCIFTLFSLESVQGAMGEAGGRTLIPGQNKHSSGQGRGSPRRLTVALPTCGLNSTVSS